MGELERQEPREERRARRAREARQLADQLAQVELRQAEIDRQIQRRRAAGVALPTLAEVLERAGVREQEWMQAQRAAVAERRGAEAVFDAVVAETLVKKMAPKLGKMLVEAQQRARAGSDAKAKRGNARDKLLRSAMNDLPRGKSESETGWTRRLAAFLAKNHRRSFDRLFPLSYDDDHTPRPRITRDALRRAAGSKPRR